MFAANDEPPTSAMGAANARMIYAVTIASRVVQLN